MKPQDALVGVVPECLTPLYESKLAKAESPLRTNESTSSGASSRKSVYLTYLGWPQPYIHTVYDRMYGNFPAKNTVYTPYIPINVWLWPILNILTAFWGWIELLLGRGVSIRVHKHTNYLDYALIFISGQQGQINSNNTMSSSYLHVLNSLPRKMQIFKITAGTP